MAALRLASCAVPVLPHVWQGEALAAAPEALPTGHPALNTHLPGGGWPVDGLVELLQAQPGMHVWQLLLPALAQAVKAQPGPVVLVGAPFEPFGPALSAQGLPGERLLWVRGDKPAARLWAAEQALRCADVTAVLAWLPQARADQLRRLHLAAQQGQRQRLLFVFRTPAAQHESSPARLRLLLQGTDALQVRILKRRGPPVDTPVLLPAHPPRLAALLASRRQQFAPPAAPQPRSLTLIQSHALDRPVTA